VHALIVRLKKAMPIAENIVILLDPQLEQHLEFAWPDDDLIAIETKVLVIRASHDPVVIYNCWPIDSPFEATTTVEASGHEFLPAFEFYSHLRLKSEIRNRDLLIIVSGSKNLDNSLEHAFAALRPVRSSLLGVMLIDLGGYVTTKDKKTVDCHTDYVVTIGGYVIGKDALFKLWNWLPDCLRGFQMYWFEGHHPNGPTYLVHPPHPFVGIDCAQMRHDRFFVGEQDAS
jgi:hypothetical protein